MGGGGGPCCGRDLQTAAVCVCQRQGRGRGRGRGQGHVRCEGGIDPFRVLLLSDPRCLGGVVGDELAKRSKDCRVAVTQDEFVERLSAATRSRRSLERQSVVRFPWSVPQAMRPLKELHRVGSQLPRHRRLHCSSVPDSSSRRVPCQVLTKCHVAKRWCNSSLLCLLKFHAQSRMLFLKGTSERRVTTHGLSTARATSRKWIVMVLNSRAPQPKFLPCALRHGSKDVEHSELRSLWAKSLPGPGKCRQTFLTPTTVQLRLWIYLLALPNPSGGPRSLLHAASAAVGSRGRLQSCVCWGFTRLFSAGGYAA